jgi:cell division protein ZapB
MSAEQFRTLEQQIDQMIYRCQQLEQENNRLLKLETSWKKERGQLIDKNELARSRVEAMIHRLQALEREYGAGDGSEPLTVGNTLP